MRLLNYSTTSVSTSSLESTTTILIAKKWKIIACAAIIVGWRRCDAIISARHGSVLPPLQPSSSLPSLLYKPSWLYSLESKNVLNWISFKWCFSHFRIQQLLQFYSMLNFPLLNLYLTLILFLAWVRTPSIWDHIIIKTKTIIIANGSKKLKKKKKKTIVVLSSYRIKIKIKMKFLRFLQNQYLRTKSSPINV